MQKILPTIILRHKRENVKKCSLRGLESRTDTTFFTYPKDNLPDLSSYLLLSIDAPELSKEDKDMGLFLIDGTWRYSQVMFNQFSDPLPFAIRSLPKSFQTAYPRRQEDCPDPSRGLASVEALYIAYVITGRDPAGLLDHYHWKDLFLKMNHSELERFSL